MPSFTAKDMERFRLARAKSIWARRGDISANADALVIFRHDIVEECRGRLDSEIKIAKEACARATQNGCVEEATASAAVAAKLTSVRNSLQDLVDMDLHKKLKG